MIALLGSLAIAAGLASAMTATVAWAATAALGQPRLRVLAHTASWSTLAAAAVAAGLLEWALLAPDFSLQYVAENGGRAVPAYYRAISMWGALEGSLLLWLLVHAGYTVAVARRARHPDDALTGWALAVLSAVAALFFAVAAFAGNPFTPVDPVPADGPGPNPLLQDHPLMGIHPPLLYLGFVGLAVPFAYAVAALLTGDLGDRWLRVARGWTVVAWAFLTLGIFAGAWWSYEVLGWGGYWAWDPVENASLLPWLTTTALLHSMMVQRRRPVLRGWNLALAAAGFLLVLIGTYLTRSGVLASVHAFTESAVGPILLAFVVLALVGIAGLLMMRAGQLRGPERIEPGISRESVLLTNNILLVGLALTVLFGTVFPLLVEALNGDRVSVGAPYFDRVAVPVALAVVLLMGVGPLVAWGHTEAVSLAGRLAVPTVIGLLVTGGLGLAGATGVAALVTFGLGAFVLTTIVQRIAEGARAVRRSTGLSAPSAAVLAVWRRRQSYGALVAHAGVALAAVAVAASSTYAIERTLRMEMGEAARIGDYVVRLEGIDRDATARRMSVVVRLAADRAGEPLETLDPRLSFYPGATQPVASPAISSQATDDLYVTVVGADQEARWANVILRVNPLVSWLWMAGALMAAGAALAALPQRRRRSAVDGAGAHGRVTEGVSME